MKRRKRRDYAVYKGDDFIMLGNRDEVAAYLGINLATVWRLMKPERVEFAELNDEYYIIEVEDDA